jgi:AraC-like DNA-binding protein
MIQAGPDEKVYPVVKIAVVVNALQAEGIASAKALESVALSESDLISPATRVSLNQVIRCYRNALQLSADPNFAYHTGLRFHVSTYGMYGFAILSSMNFRRTMRFTERYHQLATPTAAVSFKERGDRAEWIFVPVPHPEVEAALYRFLVELQIGAQTSVQRDVMGPSFAARELHVTYGPTDTTRDYEETFGCRVAFGQTDNKFIFDAAWLDGTPKFGNVVTYSSVLGLCDQLMEEFRLSVGLAGKVREALLVNLARRTSFNAVAKHLKMSARTLRRAPQEENTSFREVADELRTQMAIKYLRDTDLTIEEIAVALGFSEAAGFRQAFRRWTKEAPNEFRRRAKP